LELEGRKILVTGSEGFIGSRLVSLLKKRGTEVRTLKRNGRIDVRDWSKIRSLDQVNIVYHLAAKTFVPFSFRHPRETYEVNVLGTLNILEFCRLRDVEKMIFASTYVYGNPQYLPVDEKHPINPTNPYAKSKVLAEMLCKSYHEDYGLKCIIARPFNIYGEGQKEHFLIPSIVKQIFRGKIKLNSPKPRRDFLYVDDVVSAFVKMGEYPCKSGWDVYNLGYGKSYSVQEIVELLIKICGKHVRVTYIGKRRKGEIMDAVADIRKAREKLNWVPKVKISEGLEKVAESYFT
jgi:UDP-glucose 4-epimerase